MTDSSTTADAPLKGPARIEAYLKTLPDAPGVYRMLNDKGDVLYVGKAKSLKKRVTSYARGMVHSDRLTRMIADTAEMIFVTTASEIEALLLESNLIKRLKPRYNVSYRDDKSFPNILLREDHAFPQLLKHRGAKSTKGVYFGPFASAGAVNRTLNTLQRAFLLRSCSDSVFESRTRPCLLFQIKRCSAPCVGRVDEAGYAELVREAEEFLNGKSRAVQDELARQMNTASDQLDFEAAARFRDRIKAMSHIQSQQGINPTTFSEADVFAAFSQGGETCIQVFFFRAGQNWGNRPYFPRHPRELSTAEVLEAFVAQFYDERPAPRAIFLSEDIANRELIEEAFRLKAGHAVEIAVPQRGEKREIVEIGAAERPRAACAPHGRELRATRTTGRRGGDLRHGEPAAAHRGLRQLPHPGHQCAGRHDRRGARRLRERRVPQVQHQIDRTHARRRLRHDARSADAPFFPPREGERRGRSQGQVAGSRADRRRARPALGRARRARRPWRGGCAPRRHLQGAGSRRGPRALLHGRPRAVPPRSQEPGALLPAAPARRGAQIRHRQPSQEAQQGHRRQPAGRDRGRGRRPQARAVAAFRLGKGGIGRKLADLESVGGVSKTLAKKVYDFFHPTG